MLSRRVPPQLHCCHHDTVLCDPVFVARRWRRIYPMNTFMCRFGPLPLPGAHSQVQGCSFAPAPCLAHICCRPYISVDRGLLQWAVAMYPPGGRRTTRVTTLRVATTLRLALLPLLLPTRAAIESCSSAGYVPTLAFFLLSLHRLFSCRMCTIYMCYTSPTRFPTALASGYKAWIATCPCCC